MSVTETYRSVTEHASGRTWPGGAAVDHPFGEPPGHGWLKGTTDGDGWLSSDGRLRASRGFPWLLLLMVLLAAHPVRVPLGSETVSVFDLALVPLGLIFLVRRISRRRMEWGPRIILVALITQFAITLLSMIWTVSPSETLVVTVVAAEALVVYLLVLDFGGGRSPAHIAGLVGLYALLLVASSVATFIGVPGFEPPATVEDPWGWTTRLSHSLIGKSNNLATLLVPIFPVVWYAGKLLDRMWLRATAWITVAATVLTLSRGAMLAFAVMAGVWFLVRPVSRRPRSQHRVRQVSTILTTGLIVLIGGAAVLIGLAAAQGRGVSLDGRFSLDDNGRFELYLKALARASERLLGFGPGASEVDVHNTYLQSMVDFGVVFGLLFVASFVMLLAPWFMSAYRSVSEDTRKIVGVAFAGILVICMVESSYEGTLLRQLMWLVLALGGAWHPTTSRRAEGDPGWDCRNEGWRMPDRQGWLGRDA